ncbi:hypothetical protein BGZ80_004985 [Entomortierella chlamydospora]|uniref:Uncharacterized protein n=1 Tax=Entomortierella chlamydospora TaxID=101097 RepID=A0A9P6MZT0_9FUNG|nr:hypothetical protein BGZ79_010729 [Entomortierella chlamydospora]KAG0019967.1 hypothetical protein BGZ80_004985 [Entomortierella chlamydospora]
MPASADPLRECLSNFWSGLKYFKKALRHRHDKKIRRAIWKLSVSCLLLHAISSVLAFILPHSLYPTSKQLFYPIIFLYRYARPEPWDQLFINTVRSLGYSGRPDIVAKPSPSYFGQLKNYCRRTLMAYLGVWVIQYLVNWTGLFKLPSNILALLAVNQLLQYRGIKKALWMLVLISLFIGPRWPVWAIQTFALQQLLIYELLQPYLARVNFKIWEERAWFAQYDCELRGFALGAWLLCSIPWIGAGFIPFLFPATAFFLTQSCGSLESSSRGLQGDVIERRSPGVKAVAHGKSKSTEGTWDETGIRTFVRATDRTVFKPKDHSMSKDTGYKIDPGLDRPVAGEQIQTDKEASLLRKTELYDQSRRNWDPRIYRNSFFSSEPRTAWTSKKSTPQEDFTKYNFSDRKTLESTPSAPPEPPDGSVMDSGDRLDESDAFRVPSDTGMETSPDDQQVQSATKYENRVHAKETGRRASRQVRSANKESHQTSNTPHWAEGSAPKALRKSGTAGEVKEEQRNEEEEEIDEEDEDYMENDSRDYIDYIYGQSDSVEMPRGFDGLENRASWSARRGRGQRGSLRGTRCFNGRRGYSRGGRIGRGSRSRDVDRNSRGGPMLATIISRGVQNIEEQVSQQLGGWGKQLAQRLGRVVSDPDSSRGSSR